MTHTLDSTAMVAVADYYWRPMTDCPRGVKVQLLGAGGVAVYGQYSPDPFWVGWAPLPRRPKLTSLGAPAS